jgi:uncharacterized membrane protein
MGEKIKMLRKDAVISIKIGTGFLKKIQEVLMDVSAGHTEEEFEQMNNLINENKELTESWMESVYTLSVLIKTIEDSAIEQDLTYEEDIDNIIPKED